MSVRFILGPAGSGKTHYCVTQIAARIAADPLGAPLLFIVPQQATFLHEKLLAASCSGGGFCRAQVMGFARLARRAGAASGAELLPAASEAGKLLLMKSAMHDRSGELPIFAPLLRRASFAAQMKAIAEELQVYDVSADALLQTADVLTEADPNSHFAAKLREIALLYQSYSDSVSGCYDSYAENMRLLTEQIDAGLLAETEIFIDGYSEFSPMEQQVVAAMMRHARAVHICLALDMSRAEKVWRETDVFYPTWHTYGALHDIAERAKVQIEVPLMLKRGQGRFAANAELDLLERGMSGLHVKPCADVPQRISLWQCDDTRAELRAVGREIRRLVREQGLRYRDISIVARDSAPYERLLGEVFDAMEIPYFLDNRKKLLYHPLIEFVRAVLALWAGKLHYQPMMRLLKNPLSSLTAEEADRLDNYCLAHGVRFYHWRKDEWQFSLVPPEDEEYRQQIDELRRHAVAPLFALTDSLGERSCAATLHKVINDFLRAVGVEEKLSQWRDAALSAGSGEEAATHAQAWDKLQAFFDEAEQLLGVAEFDAAEMCELYDAAFAGMTFATIPPGLDQVLVASLERSRNPEIKACFVLGVNDGVLPRRMTEQGLLRDEERRVLAAHGIRLAADSHTRQFAENYLCYIALTRSGSHLYISYPLRDAAGGVVQPSPLLRQVRQIFPQLTVKQIGTPDAAHLVGGSIDLEEAAVRIRQDKTDALWSGVYEYFAQNARYGQSLRLLKRGLYFSPEQAPLSSRVVSELYGSTLRSSVSRLEKFRLCPFSYFAAYGLKLSPRRKYQLTPADRGELFHLVLSDVGRYITEHKINWRDLDEALAASLVDTALSEYLPRYLSELLTSSARYAYVAGRIRRALVAAVLLAAEHIKRGSFVPVAYELPFGHGDDGLPAFAVELGDGRRMMLSGQIDRVDMAESADGSAAYLRVIDYKTGGVSLRREDIEAGLRLQLLVYLQVVLENSASFTDKIALPAGMYYAPLRDSLTIVNNASETVRPEGLRLVGLTAANNEAVQLADHDINGWSELINIAYSPDKGKFYDNCQPLTDEELTYLRQQLLANIKASAAAMLDGLVNAAPVVDANHDACAWCDFRAVCGFDRRGGLPAMEDEE